MKLSVIIVNYNVKYFLEQALYAVKKSCQNLLNFNPSYTCEIFVVDNNSVDGSAAMVAKKFPDVKLIVNNVNKGFSAANNQAIKIAAGQYILLLNPDTVVEENTFAKCIQFMDEKIHAGAMGVKMLDGSGKFLSESKRSLPTPSVAFYKIFGFSKLFPRSKTFGKYHLSYLDNDQVHEVEVLAGAFMLIRKQVLDKIGLLDETFFMYGEDIDLSYRILQAGFKNYYYPLTRIIHYKGESTKKSSINYVIVFYKAMVIFARKHFSKHHAWLFSFLINFAIYIRALVSILFRMLKQLAFPFFDVAILYTGMYFLKRYWEINHKYVDGVYYPIEYMLYSVSGYIIVWLSAVFLIGGYDKPVQINRIVKGVLIGTLVILAIYGLLPEEFRYSRALILLGSAWALFAMSSTRLLVHFIKHKNINIGEQRNKNVIIVGNQTESQRVLSLLNQTGNSSDFVGFIGTDAINNAFNENQYYLGNIHKLKDIVEVYNIEEIIFCSKDISSEAIIDCMSNIAVKGFNNNKNIECKIAPPESLFIIGSHSAKYPGNLYTIDIELAINNPVNKRHKRLLDIAVSLFLLAAGVFVCWFLKNPLGLFKNIISVISGNTTWIGYAVHNNITQNCAADENLLSEKNHNIILNKLPEIKKGIITIVDAFDENKYDNTTVDRLNMLYAKNYKVEDDIKILLKGFRKLGKK